MIDNKRIEEATAPYLEFLYKNFGLNLSELKHYYVKTAVRCCDNNKTLAGRTLGIQRRTINNHLKTLREEDIT